MKKYLDWLVPGLVLVALVGLIIYDQSQKSLGAGGPFNNVKQYLTVNATPYMNHSTSTSTQTNLVMIGNATTSYDFSTDGSDQVNFNLFTAMATTTSLVAGSGTPTTATTSNTALDLVWYYEFSDDEVNWFSEEATTTVSNGVVTHAVRTLHNWSPGTIATSTIDLSLLNVNSKYMRVSFSSWTATSTRVGLWAEAILKKGY